MDSTKQVAGFLMHPKDLEKLIEELKVILGPIFRGDGDRVPVLGIRLIPNEWLAEGSKPIPLTAEDIAERTWEKRVRKDWGGDEPYLRCEKDDR